VNYLAQQDSEVPHGGNLDLHNSIRIARHGPFAGVEGGLVWTLAPAQLVSASWVAHVGQFFLTLNGLTTRAMHYHCIELQISEHRCQNCFAQQPIPFAPSLASSPLSDATSPRRPRRDLYNPCFH
jgi:hypothetical protein